MAPDQHDPVAAALDDLRADLGTLHLAPASEVRRRGAQRRRHRRIGLTATTVAAVAAIGVGSGRLLDPVGTVRPAPPASGSVGVVTPSPTTTATSPSTATATAGPTPTDLPVVTVRPAAPGGGTVAAAYFLPGKRWQGPDLNRGRAMVSAAPKETEGSVTRFACDPDTDIAGDVAFLQVTERSGTFVGTQKVRLLGSAARATTVAEQMAAAMPRCQERLRDQAVRDAGALPPGETAPVPNADVVEDAQGRVDDATGSVRIYRTSSDYGTGASSVTTDWVVLAREGSAVTFLDLPQFETSAVSLAALRRLADAARTQIRFAATR